jgi:hypothetical protein
MLWGDEKKARIYRPFMERAAGIESAREGPSAVADGQKAV